MAAAADEEDIFAAVPEEAAEEEGAALEAAEEPLAAWAPVPLGQRELAAAATFAASLELQLEVTQEATPDW